MTLPDKPFFRIKEICDNLQITRQSLWRWLRSGRLPALEERNARTKGYSREVLQAIVTETTQTLQSLQRGDTNRPKS